MEHNGQRRADALDHYWDAVQRGETPRQVSDIDDVAAAVIAHLDRREVSPRVQAAQQRGRIAADAKVPGEILSAVALPNAANGATPHQLISRSAPRPVAQPATPRFRWAVVQLATAALLLVTLGLGYLTLWPGRAGRIGPGREPTAIEEPAMVSGEQVAEPLVRLAILADEIPDWRMADATLARYRIDPNSGGTWDAPGLRVEYLVRGGYIVDADGSMRIVRSGAAAAETVPAGAAITMAPGDALFVPAGTVATYRHQGIDPAELVAWFLDYGSDGDPLPPTLGWTSSGHVYRTGLVPQQGPLTVQLQRVILGPDATLAAHPDALQMGIAWLENDDRSLTRYDLASTSDGAIRNLGNSAITVYVATIETAERGPPLP